MSQIEIIGLIALVLLIAAAALLAAAETAITRVSSARAEALAEEGGKGALILRDLIDRRKHVLHPILFVVLACQIGVATVVAGLVLNHWGAWQLVIVFVAELLVLFALSEALPKTGR